MDEFGHCTALCSCPLISVTVFASHISEKYQKHCLELTEAVAVVQILIILQTSCALCQMMGTGEERRETASLCGLESNGAVFIITDQTSRHGV